jgi:uncharacterized repeat protein (TIGR01451 family)
MGQRRPISFRFRLAAAFAVGSLVAAAAAALSGSSLATAATSPTPAAHVDLNLLDAPQGLDDYDARTGSVAPTAARQSIVRGLGADVTWNRFGTPESLIRYGGYLATGLSSDAVTAARTWLKSKASLFRLSSSGVDALELVSDAPMRGSAGHAVLFRQRFGSLPATQDGLVTVGVTGGKVAYVSSSAAGAQPAPPAPVLTATAAWLKAAANVGRPTAATGLSAPKTDPRTGWTVFRAPGFAQTQRVRLTALPLYTGGTRPAYEANVVDVQGGAAAAYTVYVDGVTGSVLVRVNRVQQTNQADAFTGTYSPTACGPLHSYNVDANTKSIDVVASAAIVTNDIVLNLIHDGNTVATSDTATSPEAIHYAPAVVAPGVYSVQVCPFNPPTVPHEPPFTYAGAFSSNDAPGATFPYPPQWKFFRNAPPLDYANHSDTRIQACWQRSVNGTPVPGCQLELRNLASRVPWDHGVQTNTPTFTSLGNNANTAEAWTSPLTPGPVQQRPVSPDRKYGFGGTTTPHQGFTDSWNRNNCSPASFAPTNNNNDILASVTNLFSGHNRFHDFSYFLGFTEQNFNAQLNNFGNTAPGPYPQGRELDPEVGNVQAGALTGGQPSFRGRDNANQITLQDGVPPITNQYLFQPLAGGFYAPCVDGDYDTTVFGHEYTHLISNRMVAGPDSGLSGFQAGSMGESWSDQVALEYLHEYGYIPQNGENPWALGPYVTANTQTGIRNYALNANPLNYSDLGYDIPGPEVHSDGEVWNATAYAIRQALVAKYNNSYPASNAGLQRQCADGVRRANLCPGNRRWIQIMFDAFLLQPSGTSMLTARDAYLAADIMRFGGANQKELWREFARTGMGCDALPNCPGGATTNGTADDQPVPSFQTPVETNEASVVFKATDMTKTGQPAVGGKLYVGRYEARATPIATTNPAVAGGAVTVKMVPGSYEFVFQSPGYGMRRFALTVGAGQTVSRVLHLAPNLASKTMGASATGGTNADALIDDTEATDWTGTSANVATTKPTVTVKLAGTGPQTVRSVQLSAMLTPGQNRFTALRQFAIETCVASTANVNCTTGFTEIYRSPANAFPSVRPRPLAPDLILRAFDVKDTPATHVRLVVLQNQCTGTPEYRGEQDSDPTNTTDCVAGSAREGEVHAAELQVYSFDASTRPPGDPVVATTMTAPATAPSGSTITYDISYRNLGPNSAAASKITDVLPAGLTFVSATDGGAYDSSTRTLTWSLGTVPVNGTGTVHLTGKVTATAGTAILNQANYTGAETVGLPSAALTTVLP